MSHYTAISFWWQNWDSILCFWLDTKPGNYGVCECVFACVCLVVVNTCYYLAIPTSTLSYLTIAHWFSSVGRESTVLSLEKWLTARRASIWLQPCLSEHHIQEPDRVRAKKTLGDNWEDNLDFLFYGICSRKDGRLELLQLSHHHRKFEWMQRKQSLDMGRKRSWVLHHCWDPWITLHPKSAVTPAFSSLLSGSNQCQLVSKHYTIMELQKVITAFLAK